MNHSNFSMNNCLVMAKDEMNVLKQLDHSTIQKMVWNPIISEILRNFFSHYGYLSFYYIL